MTIYLINKIDAMLFMLICMGAIVLIWSLICLPQTRYKWIPYVGILLLVLATLLPNGSTIREWSYNSTPCHETWDMGQEI